MVKFKSIKVALAIAAGVMALALSAPAAIAGTLTYEFDYTAGTSTGYQTSVESIITIDSTAVSTLVQNGETYYGYTVLSITGTRDVTNLSTGSVSSGTITELDAVGTLNNDNIIYISASGDFTVDQFGIAFAATSTSHSHTNIDDYSVFYDTTTGSLGYENYVENNSTNNIAVIDSASLTQVPTPVPLALLGVGLFGLGVMRRRQAA